MKTFSIVLALTALLTVPAFADTTPMQCNLTCSTPAITPTQITAPTSISVQETEADSSNLVVSDEPVNTGFDFVAECVQYREKIWAWRESKCKSISPDWKSPGIGNYLPR